MLKSHKTHKNLRKYIVFLFLIAFNRLLTIIPIVSTCFTIKQQCLLIVGCEIVSIQIFAFHIKKIVCNKYLSQKNVI